MRIWKNTAWDGLLLGFSVLQLVVTTWLMAEWDEASTVMRIGSFGAIAIMTAYNIIVVSHLFTHVPWFESDRLNAAVSVLNSVNIGQSVQGYRLSHVRNHHRFNNDPKDPDGVTRDTSSTYRDGADGEHAPLLRYALGGAWSSILARGGEMLALTRLWAVGERETAILALATRRPERRGTELRQIQVDRAAHSVSLAVYATISWQWTLFCYLPAFFTALAMVNVQNYYRHFGGNPDSRSADSVSHYGRLYNLLTFNDGYHQEHHLSPTSHWTRMPVVNQKHRAQLDAQPRIVSPVPAMLGFLDRRRPLLHRKPGGVGR